MALEKEERARTAGGANPGLLCITAKFWANTKKRSVQNYQLEK